MSALNSLSNQKINVGLIGLGFGEKVHLPALISNSRFNLTSFFHPDKEKVLNKSKLNLLKGYYDWEEFLNDKNIQALVISTPPDTRFQLALDALNCSKHLFLEKPVALKSDDISVLQKIALKKKLSVGVNFEYRCVPHFNQAKKIISQGILGDTWLVKFDWLMSSRSSPKREWNWYSDSKKGGGVVGALGTHAFDILHWLIGPTVSVSSLLSTSITSRKFPKNDSKQKVTSEDTCFAHLELLDQYNNQRVPCQVALSAVAINGRGCWIEIYGSKGKLLLGSDNQKDYVHGFGLWLCMNGERPVPITPDKEFILKKTWEDGRVAPIKELHSLWAQSIMKHQPIIPGLSEAYDSQMVCDLIKESSLNGITISTELI